MNHFIIQKTTLRMWGPFDSTDAAWHYLFNRESTREERVTYVNSGWWVGTLENSQLG